MRNLLALVGLVVVGAAGIGWYLGWYKVGVQAGTDGQRRITIDVDTKKVSTDAKQAGEAVAEFVDDKNKKADAAKNEVKQAAEALVGPPAPAGTPGNGVTIQFPSIKIGGTPDRK